MIIKTSSVILCLHPKIHPQMSLVKHRALVWFILTFSQAERLSVTTYESQKKTPTRSASLNQLSPLLCMWERSSRWMPLFTFPGVQWKMHDTDEWLWGHFCCSREYRITVSKDRRAVYMTVALVSSLHLWHLTNSCSMKTVQLTVVESWYLTPVFGGVRVTQKDIVSDLRVSC